MTDLAPRQRRIVLRDYRVAVDIGFHEFEIGVPQSLLVSVEVWLDEAHFAADDRVNSAWNYDLLRQETERLAGAARYNLQETFARALYDYVAGRPGVIALRVATAKPDVYPGCAGVGVELASFVRGAPNLSG